jgi:hypothetical protein
VLTLAASCHFGYCAVSIVFFLSFPLAGPPLLEIPKKLLSPGTEPAFGGPADVECRGISATLSSDSASL